MTMPYDIGQATDIGHRRKNQDRCAAAERSGAVLLILADGMGGHPKGEAAAETVVKTCSRLFRQAAMSVQDPPELLQQLLHAAHQEVIRFGRRRRPPVNPRSTAILALVSGSTLHWAHLGDSRLYLFRKGELAAQTVDHSYVEKLRQQGVLSEQEMESHPFRNYVTRCIGGADVPPIPSSEGPVQLQQDDVIMLCSDGLWSQIEPALIGAALEGPGDLTQIITELVQRAVRAAAPSSDNVTALAVRWRGGSPSETPDAPGDDLAKAIANIRQAIEQFETEQEQEQEPEREGEEEE
jgi:serine/threonine protein phosphatase PrpC